MWSRQCKTTDGFDVLIDGNDIKKIKVENSITTIVMTNNDVYDIVGEYYIYIDSIGNKIFQKKE